MTESSHFDVLNALITSLQRWKIVRPQWRRSVETTQAQTPIPLALTMSVVGNNRVGIPIVLLHDAEGAVVTVETKNGQLIRGMLFEAEDMMNLYLKNAIVTSPQGVKRKVNQIYIRGPEIVFILLPDMLKHAPMFQRYVMCIVVVVDSCRTFHKRLCQ